MLIAHEQQVTLDVYKHDVISSNRTSYTLHYLSDDPAAFILLYFGIWNTICILNYYCRFYYGQEKLQQNIVCDHCMPLGAFRLTYLYFLDKPSVVL